MSLEITPAFEPQSGTWSYLLADTSQSVAVIIDPVWVYDLVSGQADTGFIDQLLKLASERDYRIEWVLETHAHADHLTAADYIKEKTGARTAIGRGICAVQASFCKAFNLKDVAVDGSQFDRLLSEGDSVTLGSKQIRIMETPGHTSDSITYLVDDAAFIGDTLFAPAFGSARCDFPGGNAADLFDSIQRIHSLGDNTVLYLCHDYPKAGSEPINAVPVTESRSSNIHINSSSDREAYILMRRTRDEGLGLPRLIMPALQVNIRAGAAPSPDDNGVPYLRIPFNKTLASILKGK